MQTPLLSLIAFVAFAALPVSASEPAAAVKPAAADKPSTAAAEPLHRRIDRLIAAKWEQANDAEAKPAPLASDEEFLRRVYLDVTGTIPTADTIREFLADKSPDKRTRLIDRLLDSPEYARQMQRRFDVMLMRRLPQKNVPAAEWREYLRESFADNKRYDQLVREILAADGREKKNRGPASFYLDRNGSVDDITRDVGRLFLGADLGCAQCHNHPEVGEWMQEHYYGISAFLVRSYVFTDKKKKRTLFAEKAEGEVSFQNVFEIRDKEQSKKKGKGKDDDTKTTLPKLFEIVMSREPEFKKGEAYVTKPSKTAPGNPKFSRRELLPKLITSSENDRFPRTAANRLWEMYLGRGLVHPVDRDHSDNPPSHPELLQLLTREFRGRDFDVKWFVRELLLSETYQRSSKMDDSAAGQSDDSADNADSLFAQAKLRPLSPAQFAWSVLQATGEAGVHRRSLGKKLTEEALYKRLAGHENRFVSLFGGQPGEPPEDFESTVDQVLFLSNDNTIANLLKPKSGNLTDRLLKLPADKPDRIAEELFLSVLSRQPTAQDVADVTAYLKDQTGESRTTAIQDLAWALLASAEFRFVH